MNEDSTDYLYLMADMADADKWAESWGNRMRKAAEEIEDLRLERDFWRDAFHEVAYHEPYDSSCNCVDCEPWAMREYKDGRNN